MPPKKELGFDPAKLQSMAEPLSVRVERIRGASRMPIDLPPKDGYAPGMGWDIDSVLRLENWLVTEWSGGGVYRFVISDVNGAKMEWESVYDPKLYPEKIPPTLDTRTAPSAGVSGSSWLPQVTQYQQPAPPAPTAVSAPSAPAPTPVQVTPPPSLNGAQPWMSPSWQNYPQQWGAQATPVERPAQSTVRVKDTMAQEQNRLLQDQVQRLERERLENDFNARLERERLAAQQQIQALREEMAKHGESSKSTEALEIQRMREERDRDERRREREENAAQLRALQEAQAKSAQEFRDLFLKSQEPKEDTRIKALEDMLRVQREEATRERERMEAASREREMRDEMRRNQEDLARKLEAATANKGPDPMLQMIMTFMQQQQANQMRPQDLVAIVKDASNGSDTLLRNVIGTYSDIFGSWKDATSQMLNLAGGGGESAVVSMVKEGAGHLSAIADRYLGVQRDKAVSESKAKEAQANAYANAQMAQMSQMARAQMAQQEQAQHQGLAGHTAPAQPIPSEPTAPVAQEAAPSSAPANGQHTVAAAPTTVPSVKKATNGDRTVELFGPAASDVRKLRQGVDEFMRTLAAHNADGITPVTGVQPHEVVEYLGRGLALMQQHNISVKAFDELLANGLYADFFDVLLPNAPQNYRDDCVTILMQQMGNGTDGDDNVEEPDLDVPEMPEVLDEDEIPAHLS